MAKKKVARPTKKAAKRRSPAAKKTATAKRGGKAAAKGKDAPASPGKRVGRRSDAHGQTLMPGHEEEKAPAPVANAGKALAEAKAAKKAASDKYKTAHALMDDAMKKHNVTSWCGSGIECSVSDAHKLNVKELKDK
ncbi:MAG: hypothetical protein AAF589_09350 [Planctomycetota bacterium]